MEACLGTAFNYNNEPTCYAKQVSNWDLVAETATCIYVHETLTLLSDYNLDGVFDTERSDRLNFYESSSYYDPSDVDRDGYLNDVDAFPTVETEWVDSDGDGG